MRIIPEEKIKTTAIKELIDALGDMREGNKKDAYQRVKHVIYLLSDYK